MVQLLQWLSQHLFSTQVAVAVLVLFMLKAESTRGAGVSRKLRLGLVMLLVRFKLAMGMVGSALARIWTVVNIVARAMQRRRALKIMMSCC